MIFNPSSGYAAADDKGNMISSVGGYAGTDDNNSIS